MERGIHSELVQDTVSTAQRSCSSNLAAEDNNLVARRYHNTVAKGKLHQAVRQLTNRDGGGILQLDEPDTKTGRRVIEVLSDKYPAMRILDLERTDWASFEV